MCTPNSLTMGQMIKISCYFSIFLTNRHNFAQCIALRYACVDSYSVVKKKPLHGLEAVVEASMVQIHKILMSSGTATNKNVLYGHLIDKHAHYAY